MQVKTDAVPPKELSLEEFKEQAHLLATEIVQQVLRPKQPLRTTVVLEALALLYRSHARTLPPEVHAACGVALAGIADDLMQTPATPHSAPAGAPIH